MRGEEEMVYVLRDEPLPKIEDSENEDGEETADDASDAFDSDDSWRDDPRQEWRRWYDERKVVTGIASTSDIEIVEGLEDGEKVALADPSKPQEERS